MLVHVLGHSSKSWSQQTPGQWNRCLTSGSLRWIWQLSGFEGSDGGKGMREHMQEAGSGVGMRDGGDEGKM